MIGAGGRRRVKAARVTDVGGGGSGPCASHTHSAAATKLCNPSLATGVRPAALDA